MMKKIKSLHLWCNKYEWIIFLITLVLVLRLPSFVMPHYYGDEEIYFVMGRAWSEGVPLYKAMFDHKPPLIYIMAGIAPTMMAFRGLLAAVMVIHTVLFWKLAQKFFAKTKPILAYLSSIIFVALTTLPTFEGLTVNAELLMMMPVTAAVLILWSAEKNDWKKYLLAGLLGGIGWLFKIPVAFDMVAIGLFFFVFNKSTVKGSIKGIFSWSFLSYALAFVAPLLLTFVYYYAKGTGPDYLATVLTVNLGYVSSWSTSTYTFNPFKSGLFVRGVVLAGFSAVVYLMRNKLDKRFLLTVLWVAFSLFGALLSARPYPHYLQELAAPVSLLIPFVFVIENVFSWAILGAIIATGVLVQNQIKFWAYPTVSVYKTYLDYELGKIGWDEYLGRFDNATRNYQVAKYLNERLVESDKIYVWGTDPTIYNLTKKLPTGGKYIVSFHVRDLNMYEYTINNLQEVMPKYVVVLPGTTEFPQLRTLLDHKYVQVKTIENVEIFIRL